MLGVHRLTPDLQIDAVIWKNWFQLLRNVPINVLNTLYMYSSETIQRETTCCIVI